MEGSKSNSVIHQLYVRQVLGQGIGCLGDLTFEQHLTKGPLDAQDFDECIKLVDLVLEQAGNKCEYAIYVKALIERQRGKRYSHIYYIAICDVCVCMVTRPEL